MNINIIVCDDDNNSLRLNCYYIERLVSRLNVDANVISFNNGANVLEFAGIIDIAFLDIGLNDMSGIILAANLLKKNPRIITVFITGHREFAYEAFNVEAFGFLVKPYDPERLERIFRKAILQFNNMRIMLHNAPLVITEDNIKKKINQCNILYIERVHSQSVIITKSYKHYVYETITSLANRLEENFIQINQGIIINMDETSDLNGRHAIMKTGEIFPVGRTYSKLARKKYLEHPRL
jgi:DNA-binding LytR/AlgR family response regulator